MYLYKEIIHEMGSCYRLCAKFVCWMIRYEHSKYRHNYIWIYSSIHLFERLRDIYAYVFYMVIMLDILHITQISHIQ